jgi:glutaredoxin
MELIRFYYRQSCSHSQMMLATFKQYKVKHELLDVTQNAEFAIHLKEIAHGYLSVPTLEFPDGKVMVEPSVNQCIQYIKTNYPELMEQPVSFWQTLFKKKGQS